MGGYTVKNEDEIRNEIASSETTLEKLRQRYVSTEDTEAKDVVKCSIFQEEGIILALKWVLGENDRYD